MFNAMASSIESSLLLIGDVSLQALAGINALPQGYDVTMANLVVGLDSIRLRALYDVIDEMMGWEDD